MRTSKAMTRGLFILLAGVIFMLPTPASAAGKFIQVWRGGGYDMYVNTASIVHMKDITSFWVKSVYSDTARAEVRKELPAKYQKEPVQYGMEYLQYNAKTNKYNVKMCSVYAGGREIFREGSKVWRPLRKGTLADTVRSKVAEYLQAKD